MTATGSAISLADLEGVVGAGNVHDAAAPDAIDGVQPRWIAAPGSVQEASELLRLAHEAGLQVAPRGGGSKMTLGNRPAGVDLVVSMARLNRVLEHSAGDLVARVEAGARLEDMQTAFSEAGQWLPLDPPERGATIGGIVAANASGPHRLRYGTARDLLIGLTYVLPDGTVAKTGGKVVKNVAGYDLCKLFTGSLGTLALLVEAIVRLYPLPVARRTVLLWPLDDLGVLGEAVQSILHSALVPAALEFRWRDHKGALAVLFEGVESGVAHQAEQALPLLAPHGRARILDSEWQGWQREIETPPDGVTLKVSAVPTQLYPLLGEALKLAGRQQVDARLAGHAGSGIAYLDLQGGTESLRAVIAGVRREATSRAGSVVVHRAPLSIKEGLDVWGDGSEALPLMRRVKGRFDPHTMLNPGRFVGGI
jgi:glycolate oxidase FAD binding subunit